jgi:DNA-binding response OmpR family regulator
MAPDEPRPITSAQARPGRAGTPFLPLYPLLMIVRQLLSAPYRGSPLASVADLVIDRESRVVRTGAAAVELTFREFELLVFLTANPGRVFSREQLLGRVWGRGPGHATRTVDVHVHRLRRKLGPGYGQSLVTVRNVGYKFASPGYLAGILAPVPETAGNKPEI